MLRFIILVLLLSLSAPFACASTVQVVRNMDEFNELLQDAADANDYEYYDENNNLVSALNGFPYYAVGDKSQYLN